MVSRAGTIFRRQENGVSQKKGNTIFLNGKKTDPDTDKDQKKELNTTQAQEELHIPQKEAKKFDNPQNNQELEEQKPDDPTPIISIVKNVANTEEEIKAAKKRMDNLIEGTDVILFRTKSVFPFDFFPDEMIIDVTKVNVIIRDFFNSERVHSILISDISDVFIDTNPFYASLEIVDENFVENTVSIRYLPKEDAARARRIIQGLMVALSQTLDVTHMSPTELIPRLEKLGKAV